MQNLLSNEAFQNTWFSSTLSSNHSDLGQFQTKILSSYSKDILQLVDCANDIFHTFVCGHFELKFSDGL